MRTAKTTIVPPAQFTTALLSGKFDGSAAAWKDAERERVLVFSQPYLENRLVLVGRFGADVSAKTLADLKGRRVAIVEGYSYGDAVDKSGATFVRAASEEESLALLLKLAVDYTLMDDLVVDYIVRNYPKESATQAADRFDTARHARALPRDSTDAAGRPGHHRRLQCPAAAHDRRPHLPPPAARRVDSAPTSTATASPSTYRRAIARVRPNRSGSTRFSRAPRVLAEDRLAAEAADADERVQQARVLRRRQHLHRLGERARELQDHQLASARSRADRPRPSSTSSGDLAANRFDFVRSWRRAETARSRPVSGARETAAQAVCRRQRGAPTSSPHADFCPPAPRFPAHCGARLRTGSRPASFSPLRQNLTKSKQNLSQETQLTCSASERASEPRERSAPAPRRARERVGESEGRKPLG